MVVCKTCAGALWSHGEKFRKATINADRLEELDIPTLPGYYKDDEFVYDESHDDTLHIECHMCEEIVTIDEAIELI